MLQQGAAALVAQAVAVGVGGIVAPQVVDDRKLTLSNVPISTGWSHKGNLTEDTLYVRSILKADHWGMLCCDADHPRKSRSGC